MDGSGEMRERSAPSSFSQGARDAERIALGVKGATVRPNIAVRGAALRPRGAAITLVEASAAHQDADYSDFVTRDRIEARRGRSQQRTLRRELRSRPGRRHAPCVSPRRRAGAAAAWVAPPPSTPSGEAADLGDEPHHPVLVLGAAPQNRRAAADGALSPPSLALRLASLSRAAAERVHSAEEDRETGPVQETGRRWATLPFVDAVRLADEVIQLRAAAGALASGGAVGRAVASIVADTGADAGVGLSLALVRLAVRAPGAALARANGTAPACGARGATGASPRCLPTPEVRLSAIAASLSLRQAIRARPAR